MLVSEVEIHIEMLEAVVQHLLEVVPAAEEWE